MEKYGVVKSEDTCKELGKKAAAADAVKTEKQVANEVAEKLLQKQAVYSSGKRLI